VRLRPLKLPGILVILAVFAWADTAGGREPPRPSLYVLTDRQIVQVDRPTGRLFRSARLPQRSVTRIAAGPDILVVWGARTVTALDGTLLTPTGRATFADEVADVAIAGTAIVVASGPLVHVMREDLGATLTRIRVPQAVHALGAIDAVVFAIGGVAAPYHVHRLDLRRPGAPRVTTLQLPDLSGGAGRQAFGDRWYVLISGQRGVGDPPRRTTMLVLPLDPPLHVLETWPMEHRIAAFIVYEGAMYWGETDAAGQVQLYRRDVTPSGAGEVVARLGGGGDVPAHGVARSGSTLYLAAGRTVWAVDLRAKPLRGAPVYRGADTIRGIAAR